MWDCLSGGWVHQESYVHVFFFLQAVLCEIVYVVVEYTKTVMFMWMFIEGFYLHNMLVVSVFSSRPNYIMFYLAGWGEWLTMLIAHSRSSPGYLSFKSEYSQKMGINP